jgi:hypothetical protein
VMNGVREVLGKGGAIGPMVEVQARAWLQLEVGRAAQIGAFQDVLLLLALLQVAALVPTLLIRSGVRDHTPQPAKSEPG